MSLSRKLILIVTCGILAWSFQPDPLRAQKDTMAISTSTRAGGTGYVSVGYKSVKLDALTRRLNQSPLSYPTLTDQYFTIGGGGYSVDGPWLIGGEGYGLVGSSNISDSYEVEVTGGAGFFNLGYRMLKTSSLFAGPVVGFGGGGMEMRISPVKSPSSFENIIDNPKQQSTLSKGSLLLKGAIGINYVLQGASIPDKGNAHQAITMHLRAGYTFALSEDTWSMAGNELTGSPVTSLQGPFVRLMVGFGGYSL